MITKEEYYRYAEEGFNIIPLIKQIMKGENKTGLIPPLWDGKSAKRISEIISKL